MPNPKDMNQEIRERLRAWLRYYKKRRGLTNEALAKHIGIAEPTLTNALNGKSIGLDLLYKMHKTLRPADALLDDDPPSLPKD